MIIWGDIDDLYWSVYIIDKDLHIYEGTVEISVLNVKRGATSLKEAGYKLLGVENEIYFKEWIFESIFSNKQFRFGRKNA